MSFLHQILASGDVQALRARFPNLTNDREALITLHIARTKMDTMPLRLRQYSDAWLKDQGIPSMLPEELRPPIIADVVGISVNSKYPVVQQAISGVMTNAVLDCYANGDTEDEIVKRQMMEARAKERRALGLPWIGI